MQNRYVEVVGEIVVAVCLAHFPTFSSPLPRLYFRPNFWRLRVQEKAIT